MKQFKQSCFVRVEDDDKLKELIKWLREIGYKTLGFLNNDIFVATDSRGYTWITDANRGGAIYCGTNIELFKAIAAINDEDDNMQWFVYKRTGEISTKCIGSFKYPFLAHTNYRKATPEELIKYFKN